MISLNKQVVCNQVKELFHVMPPGSMPCVKIKTCMPVDKDCNP